MEKFTVVAAKATFNAGAVLALSPEQAAARAHNLKETKKKGVYDVVRTVEFKRGEEIGCDPAIVSKALLSSLDAEDENPKAKEAAIKLAAENKIDLAAVKASADHGVITVADVQAHIDARKAIADAEAQKEIAKLAKEAKIDLKTVTGTGENGAVTKEDVEKAIADAAKANG